MSAAVCRTAAIALTGLDGTIVHVEAAVSNQLPGMAIIGLPDAALVEAKQRVKLATQQAGLSLSDRFLVVNLSPAALPKHGSGFDLAIALSALAASKHLPAGSLAEVAHIGELSLGGQPVSYTHLDVYKRQQLRSWEVAVSSMSSTRSSVQTSACSPSARTKFSA